MAIEVDEGPPALVPEPRNDAVTSIELCRLLHAKRSTFYRWEKQGRFRRLEIPLGPRAHKRYSRKLVTAFLNGEIPGALRQSA